MNIRVLLIIIVGISFLFSCSKDKDVEKPIISITSPVELQKIDGGDTIKIIGTITDDQNVELITITLRDKVNTSILSTITKTPNKTGTKSYALNVNYPFDNLHLSSGQYDFNITASDGENTSTKYVPIAFKAVQKQRKGVFVVNNAGNFSDIFLLDDNFNGSFYKSVNGDFVGTAVDPINQQLINVAKSVGTISATGLVSKNEVWSVPVLGNPAIPYYTGFYYNNQNIYLGMRNGGVQGYDKNGNPNFSTGTIAGFFMESAFIHDNQYIVMEEKPIVINNPGKISLSYLYSGVRIQQSNINSDVKGIFSSTVNTIILLANDASLQAKVIFYDLPSGGTSSPFNVASLGKIDDCLELSNGIYLVAADGNLSFVNINNFSKLSYLNGVPADKIWFDKLADELYVAHGSSLRIYDYSTRLLKGSYTHPKDIDEVLFWYNK